MALLDAGQHLAAALWLILFVYHLTFLINDTRGFVVPDG
jgi:hypothetical protein